MFDSVYIFDVDGTLTSPRQPMDERFATFFQRFCENNTVYLATGSDYTKVLEQIPKNVLSVCMGVFTCMGNELWVENEVIYTRKLNLSQEVINWLYNAIQNTKYPRKKLFFNNFEYRAGMLNFSILGRDAPQAAREEYYEWDKLTNERKNLARLFSKTFSALNIEAVVGGQISLDIQEIGRDKGQIYEYLNNYRSKIFFGDRCEYGGNDYSLYSKADIKYHVVNWENVREILEDIMQSNNYYGFD